MKITSSSRVARKPISIPKGVEITINANLVSVKGAKGQMQFAIPDCVNIAKEADSLCFTTANDEKVSKAKAGTVRAVINNMVIGVSQGYEKKLRLIGVGYKAQVNGKVLNLVLGFSHPVNYPIPEGITIEAPSVTEITVKGINKQLVGQVAAEIRGFRPPEPYKGKGVRYTEEVVRQKETKKK